MKTNGSMNRCYRLVWSEVQQAWMAVAETSRGRGKASSSVGSGVAGAVKAAVMGAAGLGLMLLGAPAHAAPQGGQVTAGSASVSQSGATTTVAQSSQNVSLSWQRFNVGATETVNFVQPSAAAIAVNRIFDTQGSQILGRINANGQVWLINPNGVLFGRGAQINVGGLVASTLDVADGDLANSTRRFAGSSSASVVNQGHITAAPGGYVSLLGHQVINQGAISARLGTVALGAGNAISLNFSGSRLLGLQVEQSALNALADNGGLIQAAGGQVLMSAGARDSVLASVVNNTGVIEATTVQEHEGTIVLLGGMAAGTTNVAGTLDASAANGGDGGFIETSAHSVQVADGAQITTASAHGQQGQWLIDPYDFYIAASGGNITGATLSAALGSNSVTIETTATGTSYAGTPTVGGTSGNGDIFVNDSVSWSANTLTLSAWNNININAPLNGSGTASLAFEYGQGALAAGNTSNYNIHAPVSLPAGDNFSTQQGSDGAVLGWKVITALGAAGSISGTDLQGIQSNLTGLYVLGADIDASATSVWNAGAGFAPIGADVSSAFTGSFDGLGHSIGHLTINRPTTYYAGLFGYASAGSVIRNVGLTDVAITGEFSVGAMVGRNYGTITNVYATGSVSGTSAVGGLVGRNIGAITNSYATGIVNSPYEVGGLVGRNDGDSTGSGVISNSYATGSVIGSDYVGGLVGSNYGGITDSYATGSVSGSGGLVGGLVGISGRGSITNSYATGQVDGAYSVGGLVGNNNATISNSYATGSVTGSGVVGGLVGNNRGAIINSYATGSVSGVDEVGGLVGWNRDGAISNSYTTSSVTGIGPYVGGLVGYNDAGTITNSFWDTTINPGLDGIGLDQGTVTNVLGLSTAEMHRGANFTAAGWDFANTWVIYEDHTSPLLRSFMTALTVTANNASAPKVYDGSTTYLGTASYSVTPDSRLQGTLTYTQDSQNAGSRTITPGGLWSDQQGYLISYASGSLTVGKATLTYAPNAASFLSGQTIVGLSGAVLGFVSTDTLADSTTGTLGWSTPATSSSAPGTYRIDGGGLDALNYVFVQASAPDAAVLTLLPSTLPPTVVSTLTQVFESLPDSALSTARAQQQQALQNLQSQQQPASGSPTAFRGLGIDGPGVKLPPTLIGSAP